MSETEQNKSEEPTPFKLKRAREKGNTARGADIGYFATLLAVALFMLAAGPGMMASLAETMRRIFLSSATAAANPNHAASLTLIAYQPALQTLALLGATVFLVVCTFEIIQLRGVTFSSHPLKPDFSRLNPAKGLKRIFSVRMLKETLKSVVKLSAYLAATYLVAHHAFTTIGPSIIDASSLSGAMQAAGSSLLYTFLFLALLFAAIDQVIVRREFLKQMRMSRSELTREVKEREGEPRIKRKRKELHTEFARQTKSIGGLPGSDMLIVNPQHFAVALKYTPASMSAPQVTAKGRNRFALMLKGRATSLSITIFEAPPLARRLYRNCECGDEISPGEYREVVDLYLKLARPAAPSTETLNA
jgi:flagellar biosynthetic protein FlhB